MISLEEWADQIIQGFGGDRSLGFLKTKDAIEVF